ncbi:signal recognition particle-docking protein FtsY [Acidobacteriota bacterium]
MIKKLKDRLKKTRDSFKEKFDDVISSGKNKDEILNDLTEVLILSDVGIAVTERIVDSIRNSTKKTLSIEEMKDGLISEVTSILSLNSAESASLPQGPVIMFVGVNGGGKTTSLAKLAHRLKVGGKDIILVAADTFRAAAQEQLSIWGKRLNLPVIKGQYGADPASVVYDALQSFKARQADYMLIDTAGRIHTNKNLMNELEKIRRVISREIEGAPNEIFLVLDASIGQNALIQAREFLKFSGLTGIVLTKLDGTARGGSVIGIVDEMKLPIKYIGVGEGEDDFFPFSPEEFVEALLK